MISLCKRCDKRFENDANNHNRPKFCPDCRKQKGGNHNFLGGRGYMERLVNGEIKIKRLENEYGKGEIKWKKNICIELVSE